MKITNLTLIAALLAGAAFAQTEIQFDSAPNALQLPAGLVFGEVGGVATSSKGDIYVYTRTGHPSVTIGTARPFAHFGSKLYHFDKTGKFVEELAKDTYGFMVAAQIRVDPQDNIWVVDEFTNMVMKLNPLGNVLMLLGRKAESENVPARPANNDGSGAQSDLFARPTDVAWDAAGNIFVADGAGNARIAKFDKDGKFIKSWGKRGTGNGEFSNIMSVQVDAQGNVYAADAGNHRIQVFDNNGTFKTSYSAVNNPQALCINGQTLFASNSNPGADIDSAGEIFRMGLDGTVNGKFGRAGHRLKEFGLTNEIDCRSPNTLWVAELLNLRVQKITLK